MKALVFLLLWSSGAIFVKLGLQDASAWSFLWLRALIAVSALSCLVGAAALGRGLVVLWRQQVLVHALLAGLSMQALYQIGYFLAIFHGLPPGLLAIVLAAQPICSSWLARERHGVAGNFLLLLGFVGVAVAIIGARDVSDAGMSGIVLAVLAMSANAAGSVVQKRIQAADLRVVMAWQYMLGLIVFSGVLLWQGWRVNWTPVFVVALGWQSVLVSVVAMLLYLKMLADEPVARVNALLYLVPVCTLLLDAVIFDQPVSMLTIAGLLIVLMAVSMFRKLTGRVRRS